MSGWRIDGRGVRVHPVGDIHADQVTTRAYSVRYVRRDRPGAAIVTVYFYGQDHGPHHGESRYGMVAQTELAVCADPADPEATHIWGEHYVCQHPPAGPEPIDYACRPHPGRYATVAQAEQAARRAAERHRADQISWDGLTPWETRR